MHNVAASLHKRVLLVSVGHCATQRTPRSDNQLSTNAVSMCCMRNFQYFDTPQTIAVFNAAPLASKNTNVVLFRIGANPNLLKHDSWTAFESVVATCFWESSLSPQLLYTWARRIDSIAKMSSGSCAKHDNEKRIFMLPAKVPGRLHVCHSTVESRTVSFV